MDSIPVFTSPVQLVHDSNSYDPFSNSMTCIIWFPGIEIRCHIQYAISGHMSMFMDYLLFGSSYGSIWSLISPHIYIPSYIFPSSLVVFTTTPQHDDWGLFCHSDQLTGACPSGQVTVYTPAILMIRQVHTMPSPYTILTLIATPLRCCRDSCLTSSSPRTLRDTTIGFIMWLEPSPIEINVGI